MLTVQKTPSRFSADPAIEGRCQGKGRSLLMELMELLVLLSCTHFGRVWRLRCLPSGADPTLRLLGHLTCTMSTLPHGTSIRMMSQRFWRSWRTSCITHQCFLYFQAINVLCLQLGHHSMRRIMYYMTAFRMFLTVVTCKHSYSAKQLPIVDPEGQAHPNQRGAPAAHSAPFRLCLIFHPQVKA